MGELIGPGVVELDTLLGGWQRVTAGYLIEGPAPVLVETGSQSSVPALLAALEAHGVAADDLAGVAVTHIHLGHAVGVRLPDAGILRPSTPPPEFDLDLAVNSLHKFADRNPAGVALAHYGLVPSPLDTLVEAEETLRRWANVAEKAWQNGEDIA